VFFVEDYFFQLFFVFWSHFLFVVSVLVSDIVSNFVSHLLFVFVAFTRSPGRIHITYIRNAKGITRFGVRASKMDQQSTTFRPSRANMAKYEAKMDQDQLLVHHASNSLFVALWGFRQSFPR
jgi:hypothetical protein